MEHEGLGYFVRNQDNDNEATELVNHLFESSPFSIEIWDEQLNLVDFSNRVLSLFGVSSRQEFMVH